MSWQYPQWPPQRSNKRGFAVWDLYYTRWGNIEAGVGNGFFPDPAFDGSTKLGNYHGIAIGSRSTVERVMVQTQLVVDLIGSTGVIPVWVDGRRIIDFQACHIGMPLRGQVLGPVVIHADEVYNAATMYRPDDGTYTLAPLISSKFEQPGLHLQFLQRKQDVSLLNGPRMPMIRHVVEPGAEPSQTEVLSKIYPIAGRRSVTFQAAVTSGNSAVTFRLGVIGAKQRGSTGPEPLIETTLATATTDAGSQAVYIDLTGRAQYLAIYRLVTGQDDVDFHYDLTITDDCCGESAVALPEPAPPA